MKAVNIGPDCRDQNHQKCRGDAWDEKKDAVTESGCICHGELMTYAAPPPVVTDLGEDADDWIVAGASIRDIVLGAVARHMIDAAGFLDAMEEWLPALTDATLHYRTDWAWVPCNPDEPDDEQYLRCGDDVPAGTKAFTGTRVQL